MAITLGSRPVTLRQTFSFYVSGKDPERVRACAEQADAVVVAGSGGPASVRRLRTEGWTGAVLFDRGAYADRGLELDPLRWFDDQRGAGADRILTPGRWVGSETNHRPFTEQIEDESKLAQTHNATCLLAIDYRWLTRPGQYDEMLQAIRDLGSPIALVLGDRGDPLGHPGAVDALVALTKRVDLVSILRCDHGAIGALAFDAVHASIGLTTNHRHVVPPAVQAYGIPNDHSARVFVKDLMDWFTASTIGGWATTRVTPMCEHPCCNGQRIERFLDDRLKGEADLHNRTVLAALAQEILLCPEAGERRRAFGRMCFEAVERYGMMGSLTSEITPKPQLSQWAQYF
jgi:hypothetical protein